MGEEGKDISDTQSTNSTDMEMADRNTDISQSRVCIVTEQKNQYPIDWATAA